MTALETRQAPVSADPSTGSATTRLLGAATLIGMAVVAGLAFFVTEPDRVQQDIVRLLYVHAPIAIVTYLACVVAAVASVLVLWKKSFWWDVTAAASAEIAVLYAGLTLVTGSIWGRPTWNTWWEWGDVRLMTTLVLFLMFLGYLAYRRMIVDPGVRARRSAIVALIASLNLPLVNRSVEWWSNRTLHQKSTLVEGKMEDLTLFTLVFAIVVFALVYLWLLIHRFRVGWFEHQADTAGLAVAIEQRRAQSAEAVASSVRHPGVEHDTTDTTEQTNVTREP